MSWLSQKTHPQKCSLTRHYGSCCPPRWSPITQHPVRNRAQPDSRVSHGPRRDAVWVRPAATLCGCPALHPVTFSPALSAANQFAHFLSFSFLWFLLRAHTWQLRSTRKKKKIQNQFNYFHQKIPRYISYWCIYLHNFVYRVEILLCLLFYELFLNISWTFGHSHNFLLSYLFLLAV